MKKAIAILIVVLLTMYSNATKADFTFGESMNLGPNINSPSREQGPSISADGLECYFMSNRPGGHGDWDIWMSKRETINDEWGIPENIGLPVNSASREGQPEISSDGLSLMFDSTRPAGYGYSNLWITTRTTKDDGWGNPIYLGPVINTDDNEWDASLSADELELYFCRGTSTGPLVANVWVATRATKNDPWVESAPLTTNSSAIDSNPCILDDGLTLFFGSTRPNGYGQRDLWITTRQTKNSEWSEPVNLGPSVNSQYRDDAPNVSPDGSILYFHSDRPGGSGDRDLWQVSIIPIVDLNSDGIVDADDMCIIVDNWGTDEPLCDIGPMPWGDGIVDVQDLIVIAEYLAPAKPEVHVNEADDGGQIELDPGQILVVSLQSNPTTGYSWQLIENQESLLEQMGEPQFTQASTDGPPVVGAGGWEVFRFKAISAGQMTLELGYRRPWEEGVEPILTFSIEVIIK